MEDFLPYLEDSGINYSKFPDDKVGAYGVSLSSKGMCTPNFSYDSPKIWILSLYHSSPSLEKKIKNGYRKVLEKFANLANFSSKVFFFDCGFIHLSAQKKKDKLNNTLEILKEITAKALKEKKILIVLGPIPLYSYALISGFLEQNDEMTWCNFNPLIPLAPPLSLNGNHKIDSQNFLSHIIMTTDTNKLHYIHLGHQKYLTGNEPEILLKEMGYEAYRLGYFRENVHLIEPILRDTNILTFSLEMIKYSSFPWVFDPQPHGISSEDACQIAYYAGLGGNITVMGIFGYNPIKDKESIGASIIAHIMWHFIEGNINQFQENPLENKTKFIKYIATLPNSDETLVFYKSRLTDRWFLYVPEINKCISISYQDYIKTFQGTTPERLLSIRKKIKENN